uniref:(northern house mosquito) hypothetical protein n=1 Tax=Culex pipiens TaxID=7175 RepID=A0A8D8CAZ6_CULPI
MIASLLPLSFLASYSSSLVSLPVEPAATVISVPISKPGKELARICAVNDVCSQRGCRGPAPPSAGSTAGSKDTPENPLNAHKPTIINRNLRCLELQAFKKFS